MSRNFNSPRNSRWRILIAVFLCILAGFLLTSSSALKPASDPKNSLSQNVASGQKNLSVSPADSDESSVSATPTVSVAPTVTSAPKKKKSSSSKSKVSPEASRGVWTASGSNWMFLVDGVPYTGWLTDTDGKTYYFNEEGIMQTGWLDLDNKRYYLNLDGILQTGKITVDGQTYTLKKDGSLKNYDPQENSSDLSQDSGAENSGSDSAGAENPDTEESDTEISGQPASDASSRKAIALTFDDGPSSFTQRLLDCLESNQAKATFFMTGTEIASFPDEVKRMKELGFELGNHTYDHTELTTLSSEEISSEVSQVDEQLISLTGEAATVVRPPYGSVNDTVKSVIGVPLILWSVDTLDWQSQNVSAIVEEVMNNVQPGAIILMHDIFSTSVDAAEIVIPQLIEQGYELVTVHELAAIYGTELTAGTTYSEFSNTRQSVSGGYLAGIS